MARSVGSVSATPLVIRIDGLPATPDRLAHPALVNDGHFTAMQVRGGATRGLDRHLRRLREAHVELYGTDLDIELVRGLLRAAVADHPDAYLRATVYEEEPGTPRVMTVVRPPREASTNPQSLLPVTYVRPFAHIKHVGAFAQIRYGELAERRGFDDALLVGADGRLSETTIANIGFLDGERVVWPDGPSLHGITWQLLDAHLARRSRPVGTASITLDTVSGFDGAFLANSIGVTPVARIGDVAFPAIPDGVSDLVRLYAAIPADRI